ncbi:MAG: sugar phosphate nucleotidyltransferase [Actinomycetota bacterium]|nr:sugar phosphate nucleotidyltransferase [Actinomycetota bacterium]
MPMIKAVVMAGGEGTRMRPLTSNQPKPMVPVFNKPIMEYIIELLKQHKFNDIVVTLQFMPQMIKNYFGDGADLGVNLSYAVEQQPLGTAGSVKNAQDHLGGTFIVISGDALTDIDLTKIVEFHKSKRSMVTIALKRVENPLEFGVVITNDQGQIERFLEKPNWGEVFSDTINTGIYVLEPEIFDYIPEGESVDFSKDVFPRVLADGRPLYGCVVDGYWCDIGNYEQYVQAHQDIMQGKADLKPPGIKMRDDVWVGEGAFVDPSADISGPVVIGQHARLERDVEVHEFSVIGPNVVLKTGAHIHRSIIWENTYIGSQTHLHGGVIGKNCDIKNGARIDQGVVIGDECVIGENAIINHDVKIYPFKSVDSGATINNSIIWETRGMRSLFGKEGVTGLVGIDITPDLAVRLAMAYGTSLPKGSDVVVSGDISRAARMIKRAMISGLNATGVHCRDLRVTPTPVNRFSVHTGQGVGGFHVRVSPFDAQTIQINFFDAHGLDIKESDQRGIERYFYRGDFRRVYYTEFGGVYFPARSREYYTDGLLKAVDQRIINQRNLKIILDFYHGSASLTFPMVLGTLECEIVSLNAFTQESKIAMGQDALMDAIEQLEQTVTVFKADMGMLIDTAGEKVYLVDDQGRRLSLNQALMVFVELMSKHGGKGKLALPLSVPSMAEKIAGKYDRTVLRVKMSSRALMEAANRRDVMFAGAQGGGYIFPRFLPAYDAAMTLCQLLELLAREGRPLSAIRADLPDPFLAQKNAFCSWEQKGLVMRRLIEEAKDKNVELIDGIKIYEDGGWALILPDPDEPIFRIYAEAQNNSLAEAKVDDIIHFINSIIM